MMNHLKPASLFPWIIGLYCLGWMTSCQPPLTRVYVEVQHGETRGPLDSVMVSLLAATPTGMPSPVDSMQTGSEGKAYFEWEAQEGMAYEILVTRRNYEETVVEDGAAFSNRVAVEAGDTNVFVLSLMPILPPNPEKFDLLYEVVPIPQLIAALQTDQWTWRFLPQLQWGDIPALLEAGLDTNYVKTYPRLATSTYRPDSARIGLVAIWLVEAIRKQQLADREEVMHLMPPSRGPFLGTRKGNPSGYNSPKQMQTALEAYQSWWEAGLEGDTLSTARKNPLRGKGLSWM
ncbi:MAG: hypothetical protein AAFR61_08250 [Bacteroidota bacterium]